MVETFLTHYVCTAVLNKNCSESFHERSKNVYMYTFDMCVCLSVRTPLICFRFEQVFSAILEQLQPLCVTEQKFCTCFFHFAKPDKEEDQEEEEEEEQEVRVT